MRNHNNAATRFHLVAVAILAAMLLGPAAGLSRATEQQTFPSPDAAMAALIAAVRSSAPDQIMAILGSDLEAYNTTRDKSQDEVNRTLFLAGAHELKLEPQAGDPNTVIAYLGVLEWPFPAPLVKTATGWKFDGKAALEEIQDRQIGRNELEIIDACQSYVDAQLEYFSLDRQGDGYLQFALRINSTTGKYDGLYWSTANGEDDSPIGPFAAQAAVTEIAESDAAPLSGYYAKILTAQGESAVGGARSYLMNGRMLGGFALVAWPAEYGVTGNATFIVNQLGTVYQKDLGADTDKIARSIEEFNPDNTWKIVE